VLDAIEALIEGAATTDQQSMTIAGRSLARRTFAELMELRKPIGSKCRPRRAPRTSLQAAAANAGIHKDRQCLSDCEHELRE